MDLNWLYIKCDQPGIIKINGEAAGESGVSPAVPVAPGAPVYISFEPLCDGEGHYTLPMTRKITAGEPIAVHVKDGSVRALTWKNGVHEITLKPPVLPRASLTGWDVYRSEEARFTYEGESYAACACRDASYYFAAERASGGFISPLPPFKTARAPVYSDGVVYFGAQCERDAKVFAAYTLKDGIKEALCVRCEDFSVEDGMVSVRVHEESLAGFDSVYHYRAGGGRVAFVKKTAQYSGEEPVLKFLACVLSASSQAAMEYVTPSLKREYAFDDIAGFLNGFTGVARLPGESETGGAQEKYALIYRVSDFVSAAKAFTFVKSGNLIDDIYED